MVRIAIYRTILGRPCHCKQTYICSRAAILLIILTYLQIKNTLVYINEWHRSCSLDKQNVQKRHLYL